MKRSILRRQLGVWLFIASMVLTRAQTIDMSGTVAYQRNGSIVTVEAELIENYRPLGTVSGALALELWATDFPYVGLSLFGYRMCRAGLGTLPGGWYFENVVRTALFTEPPAGNYNIVLVLSEWTGFAYEVVDWWNFSTRQTFGIVPPIITAQPQSQTVTVGGTVTFSVSAFGSAPLIYQWRRNSVNISGATTASYTISNVQANRAGSYTVVVGNPAGIALSAAAVLTVNIPPSITTQPISRTVVAGGAVTLSVTASGTSPLSYQWFRNNLPLAGANAATYRINAAQFSDAGGYKVRVGNVVGSVDSAVATLTVTYAPLITGQPQSRTVNLGSNVTFAVVASGNPAPTYQWKFKGVNISGATASTYTRNNVQPSHAGNYTVVVRNSIGAATSQVAILAINDPPNVSLTAPTNGSVFVAPAVISLAASASDTNGTVTRVDFYQGMTLLGSAITSPYRHTWSSIPAGSYTLTARATDSFGASATSAPVNVTVGPPTSCISPPDGLVVWWPGDGNANDMLGTRNGAVYGGTDFVAGKVGQAFSFNGTNAYVRLNAVATTAVDNWAMAAWVFWKGLVGAPGKETQTLLYNGTEWDSGYGLIIAEQGLCATEPSLCSEVGRLVVLYGGVAYHATGVALDQNAWNHVALVRENSVLKLYKNGVLAFWTVTVDPNEPSPADGYTTTGAGPARCVNGLVDEVMFFDAAITAEQVRALVAVDNFGVCKPLVFSGITAQPDGTTALHLSGQAGKDLSIYASPDLLNWLSIGTVPNPTGVLQITNSDAASFRYRFYRAGVD